jgi:hypothetical protein
MKVLYFEVFNNNYISEVKQHWAQSIFEWVAFGESAFRCNL